MNGLSLIRSAHRRLIGLGAFLILSPSIAQNRGGSLNFIDTGQSLGLATSKAVSNATKQLLGKGNDVSWLAGAPELVHRL